MLFHEDGGGGDREKLYAFPRLSESVYSRSTGGLTDKCTRYPQYTDESKSQPTENQPLGRQALPIALRPASRIVVGEEGKPYVLVKLCTMKFGYSSAWT